ncbi:DUF1566 domain-containing protein [Gayadomonas joobiniege]|uniref:Lcl C-terminal domain-containing protein n=1 Tax=Gayadomonas joobiniege TaxID=1234606 RepID=UPI00035D5D9E|nr:DUF1566 domain-containing protein [Gayadomonas joobiniege]
MRNYQIFFACVLMIKPWHAFSFCSADISPTVIVEDFNLDSENGTVTDSRTGLMWSVCSYGESWDQDSASCLESPMLLNWQNSLKAAEGLTFAGYDDWRLPNIKELMSIIERSCAQPAVNISLFPSTKNDVYWTSTPVFGDSGSSADDLVWAVQFKEGSNTQHLKTSNALIRVVRKIQ